MLLKPTSVPRRFVLERDREDIYALRIWFEEDIKIDKVIDPTNIVLDQFGRDHATNTDFDPSNLLGSDKFGVSSVNTTLRIVYRELQHNPNMLLVP